MRQKLLAMLMTVIFLSTMGSVAMASPIYQGRPTTIDSSNSAGYYIWQEGDRWNVQMVNIGVRRVFSGMIETDGYFSDVLAMTSENTERIAMKVRNQKIEFNLSSLAKTDGFSFTIANSQNATFTLYIDGLAVNPSTVYIGQQNRHPVSNSFASNSVFYDAAYNGVPNLLSFQGQPTALNSGNMLGYFIWQEGERWFLRTTTQGEQRQFAGTIRTGGTFVSATRLNLEDNDIVRMNEMSNEISFDLKTTGDRDGISFQLNNSKDATFMLFLDGQAINPSNIYLGSQNLRPTVNPFSINSRDDKFTTNDDRILPSYGTTINSFSLNSQSSLSIINDNQIIPAYDTTNSNTTYQTIVSSHAQGQPTALNPGEVFGYFIWQDDQNRWILQATTTGPERQFSGTIETSGIISEARTVQSQGPYGTVVDTVSNRINFSFKTGGDQPDKVNEVSFKVTDGAELKFRLYVDGQTIEPAKIYLGKENYHPTNSAVKIYSSN